MGGPFGPEAVRHFSKDDAGAQRLLGAVIGGRYGAIGEEDEQKSPAALDGVLELFASGMGWRDAEQRIEAGVELVAVGAQRGVGERGAPSADRASPLQELTQAGREGCIAGVNGVLGVANEMGEADLVVGFGPTQLRAVAVGDPEVRTSPRNSSTTPLARLGRIRKQQSSP